ncbi:MAG: hypothetical protein OES38_03520 [Gammaproteobacteria bacterium]|nr:hypothetical protein [Gammaproteobacteria bacterium]
MFDLVQRQAGQRMGGAGHTLCKLLITCVMMLLGPTAASASPTTEIVDPAAAQALAGVHPFGLQWISWDQFGEANVSIDNGLYRISGVQVNPADADPQQARQLLRIDGAFTRIETKLLHFEGTIDIRLGRGGDTSTCRREGKMTFRYRTGKTRSWRLQQMQNPCIDHVDYVDIHIGSEWQPTDTTPRPPTRAEIWGIGGLFEAADFETDGPPGVDQFPDHPLTLYDAPAGKELGQLHYDRDTWRHFITPTQNDSTETVARSQLREVGYESAVLVGHAIAQEHINVLPQARPGGYWISIAEAQPFTLVRWIDYLASYRQGGLYPVNDLALHLRTSPSPDSESLTVMRGDLYDVTPTGVRSGNWIEAEVKHYATHPCASGEETVAQRWHGWVKAADDAGFPNLWYPTRGC